jgi:hypothetical protein
VLLLLALCPLTCLTGFVLRVLTLTAAPPSWLVCRTVPGTSLLLRRLAAVGRDLGDVSVVGVNTCSAAGVADALRLLLVVTGAGRLGAGVAAMTSTVSSGAAVDLREAG